MKTCSCFITGVGGGDAELRRINEHVCIQFPYCEVGVLAHFLGSVPPRLCLELQPPGRRCRHLLPPPASLPETPQPCAQTTDLPRPTCKPPSSSPSSPGSWEHTELLLYVLLFPHLVARRPPSSAVYIVPPPPPPTLIPRWALATWLRPLRLPPAWPMSSHFQNQHHSLNPETGFSPVFTCQDTTSLTWLMPPSRSWLRQTPNTRPSFRLLGLCMCCFLCLHGHPALTSAPRPSAARFHPCHSPAPPGSRSPPLLLWNPALSGTPVA